MTRNGGREMSGAARPWRALKAKAEENVLDIGECWVPSAGGIPGSDW